METSLTFCIFTNRSGGPFVEDVKASASGRGVGWLGSVQRVVSASIWFAGETQGEGRLSLAFGLGVRLL